MSLLDEPRGIGDDKPDTFTLPRKVDGLPCETPVTLRVALNGGYQVWARLIGKDRDHVYYALPPGLRRQGRVAATYSQSGEGQHRVMRLVEVGFARIQAVA